MTTRRGRSLAAVGMAGLVALVGCTGTEGVTAPEEGPGSTSPVRLDDVRLVSYDSCDELLDWFHQQAGSRVGAYGLDGDLVALERGATEDAQSGSTSSSPDSASSASEGSDQSSETNTQEPGIGEPDLTWTDGSRLVTTVTGRLDVVDLQAGTVTSSVELPGTEEGWSPVGLLVDGDHVLVLQRTYGYTAYDAPAASDDGATSSLPVESEPSTRLTRIDLGDQPTVVGSVVVDGDYVDARMVDGVVRAVVRTSPAQLGFVYPAGSSRAALDRAAEANRRVVEESTLDDWLPAMSVELEGQEGTGGRAVDCAAVDHPAEFGGFGVVTVIGLDLGAGAVEPLPSAAVVADAQTVYASSKGLYVAMTRWPTYQYERGADTTPTTGAPQPEQVRTDVHAFSLPSDAAATYEASGSVPGQLLGQFALSEHDGDLRVASTTTPGFSSGPIPVEPDGGIATAPATPATEPSVSEPSVSESRITVLRQDGDALAPVGEVTGLGPTEQIRGVRFAGPIAYVVTFRQTDPLYVVDLADPSAPKVAGELKIPGYSSYLQVLDPGRVLGIGQDAATDTGRTTGFQESLFDVSDPAAPQRLAQLVVPDAQSTAEYDHHALLWWSPDRLLAVPVQSWGTTRGDGSSPTSGVLVTRISDTSIDEVGTITHPDGELGSSPCPPDASCTMPTGPDLVPYPGGYPTQIERTLVADGRLVTVSALGVKISDMASLADLAWIPFEA